MENEKQTTLIRNVLSIEQSQDAIDWQYFREGIDIAPIYSDDAGCSAAFLRYAPGSSVPMHEHTGYEHILILTGAQHADGCEYRKGDLVVSPPGTTHRITSKQGCIVLALWEKPVSFDV